MFEVDQCARPCHIERSSIPSLYIALKGDEILHFVQNDNGLQVDQWGFGGGETAPENLLFRPGRATKSPYLGEIELP